MTRGEDTDLELQEIAEKVAEAVAGQAALAIAHAHHASTNATQHGCIEQKLDLLDVAVRGNGSASGLKTRLALLEQNVLEHARFRKEVRGYVKWFALGVMGLIAQLLWQVVVFVAQSGGIGNP